MTSGHDLIDRVAELVLCHINHTVGYEAIDVPSNNECTSRRAADQRESLPRRQAPLSFCLQHGFQLFHPFDSQHKLELLGTHLQHGATSTRCHAATFGTVGEFGVINRQNS
jgi:hypothetical protein